MMNEWVPGGVTIRSHCTTWTAIVMHIRGLARVNIKWYGAPPERFALSQMSLWLISAASLWSADQHCILVVG
eukprot:scaffold260278_cov31-Tisochrysis_lutea.AAC.1